MNWRALVACNFNCLVQTEGLLKITGSLVNHISGNILKMVHKTLLLQSTNRKWCMAYRIVAIWMALSIYQGRSHMASLFK